jgi:hypothetical protein
MAYRIRGIRIPVTRDDAASFEAWLNDVRSRGGTVVAGFPGPHPGTAVLIFEDAGTQLAATADEVFRGDNLSAPSE